MPTEHPDATDCIEETNECGLRKTSFSRIFTDQEKPKSTRSRSNSIESPQTTPHLTGLRRISQSKAMHSTSTNNTWNGRQKQPRQSILSPEHVFSRNSSTRRSMNGHCDQNGRRLSQSASTSPTKANLRQEILNAVLHTGDEQRMMREVERLVKQYGGLNLGDGTKGHKLSISIRFED